MMSRFCFSLFLLASVSRLFAGSAPAENFAGLTLGQSHQEIGGKVKSRDNLVGPGKGFFGDDGKLTAKTFRYTGSFNRDNNVENVMLYFSSKGTLAGMDVFLKGPSTFDRYAQEVASQYKKVSETAFTGKIATGRFKGADVSVELVKSNAQKARYRSYSVQLRCPAILKAENISMREAEKQATEAGAGKGPAKQDALNPLNRAL